MNLRSLAAGIFAVIFSTSVAQAAYVTNLNVANPAEGDPAPYGTVTIQEVGDSVDFAIELVGPFAGQAIEQFGFNPSVGLAAGNISGLPVGWSFDTSSTLGTFGTFGASVGGGDGQNPLTFSIVGIAGDTIITYASLLSSGSQPNAQSLFAAKIAADGPGAFIGGGAVVPIPPALLLFISAIAALGTVARRRRNKVAGTST